MLFPKQSFRNIFSSLSKLVYTHKITYRLHAIYFSFPLFPSPSPSLSLSLPPSLSLSLSHTHTHIYIHPHKIPLIPFQISTFIYNTFFIHFCLINEALARSVDIMIIYDTLLSLQGHPAIQDYNTVQRTRGHVYAQGWLVQ